MRKLTKALAAVLLVAVVVSVMAVLPTFTVSAAEAATEGAPASERVVIWSLDEQGDSLSIANGNTGGNTGDSMTRIEDEFGQTIWQWTHDTDGSNAYWTIAFPARTSDKSSVFADIVETEAVVTEGVTTYKPKVDESGNVVVAQERDTDFIIVDFDISTDSHFINDMFFQARNSNNQNGRAQNSKTFFTMNMVEAGEASYPTDRLTVGVNEVITSAYASPVDSGDKWTNVTLIYDFSAGFDHLAVDAGAATEWKAYVYLDGYFAGEISTDLYENQNKDHTKSLNYAHSLGQWRISSGKDGSNVEGATTNFANFTVSKFPVGYDGPLAEDGILGLHNVHLGSLSDMAYCFDNLPANPVGYTGLKLADINRPILDETTGEPVLDAETGEPTYTTIPVYDEDDLSGDIYEGDVVTLYRNLVDKVVAIYPENGKGVSFVDKNGVAVGETGCLVTAPTVIRANPDADYVIFYGSTVFQGYNENQIAHYDETAQKWYVRDMMYDKVPTGAHATVMLLDDCATYGYGGASSPDIYGDGTNVATTTTSIKTPNTVYTTYDLNGHTLTMSPKGGYLRPKNGCKIVVKNGNYIFAPSSGNFVMSNIANSGARIYFENCDIDYRNGTMIDQRHGTVAFVDCNVTACAALSETKSQTLERVSIVIDGCNVTATTAKEIVNAGNVSGYGSSRNHVALIDSSFTRTGAMGSDSSEAALIVLAARVDTNTAANSTSSCALNDNYAYVNIIGCEVADNFRNLIYQGHRNTISVTKSGHENMKLTMDIGIRGSDITSSTVLYTYFNGGVENPHTTNTKITADNSKLNYDSCFVSVTESMEKANITLDLADGVKLGNDNLGLVDTVLYDSAESKIAYSSLDADCDRIVTSSTDTYTYRLGTETPVEFYWNVPAEGTDEVKIDKVATLAPDVPGAYKYSWAVEDKAYRSVLTPDLDVNAKLNLTLFSDITMNLYVPKEICDSTAFGVSVVDVKGVALTPEAVTLDGVDYYKFATHAIAPAEAEIDTATLQVTVNGAYGESFTDNIGYSVSDYLATYTPTENEKENALIDAIINYILAAYEYMMLDTAGIEALRPATEYTVDFSDAKLESFAGASVAVKFGKELAWVIKAAPATVLDVTYSRLGASVTEKVVIPESGIAALTVAPADFLAGITISDGTASASVNLAGYYGALTDTAAQKMAAALYAYTKCAADYRVIAPAAAELASGEMVG